MKKSELIKALAKSEHLTIETAQEVVDTFFEDIENSLTNGNRVEIRGLGNFRVKQYDGYDGRNPKTGKVIKVPSKKLPCFKPGKDLKQRADDTS